MEVIVSLTNHASVFISGEIPPYHYGTHYSSTMIVASYLIRLEPFTQHFLRVQVIAMCLFCFHSATLVAVVCQSGHLCYTPTLPTYPVPLLRGEIITQKRGQSRYSIFFYVLPCWFCILNKDFCFYLITLPKTNFGCVN